MTADEILERIKILQAERAELWRADRWAISDERRDRAISRELTELQAKLKDAPILAQMKGIP